MNTYPTFRHDYTWEERRWAVRTYKELQEAAKRLGVNLPMAKFARNHDINPNTFREWIHADTQMESPRRPLDKPASNLPADILTDILVELRTMNELLTDVFSNKAVPPNILEREPWDETTI